MLIHHFVWHQRLIRIVALGTQRRRVMRGWIHTRGRHIWTIRCRVLSKQVVGRITVFKLSRNRCGSKTGNRNNSGCNKEVANHPVDSWVGCGNVRKRNMLAIVARPRLIPFRLTSPQPHSQTRYHAQHSHFDHDTTLKTVCDRFDLIGILLPDLPVLHLRFLRRCGPKVV